MNSYKVKNRILKVEPRNLTFSSLVHFGINMTPLSSVVTKVFLTSGDIIIV
jgi:hypothetical protein